MFKIDKNIEYVERKRIKGRKNKSKYSFVSDVEYGDSILCNKIELNGLANYCKRNGIPCKSQYVDERDYKEAIARADSKWRIWFYPKK